MQSPKGIFSNPFSTTILFFIISGCFAGGVYLALWFTVLQPQLETQEKILSVFALFPIVSIVLMIDKVSFAPHEYLNSMLFSSLSLYLK